MPYIDFISELHKQTKRDYLSRVNNKQYPKYKAAELSKKWDYDYWDGSRNICYGGYKYLPGRWNNVISRMIEHYKLQKNSKILDVGCGKGFFLKDFKKILPEIEINGLDISKYAIENSPEDIKKNIKLGNATKLPWPDNYFDLVVSFNTFHNLYNFELEKALIEFERVGKNKYICVESYRSEKEKVNLLYWQVTCEAFCNEKEWLWWFNKSNYTGDYSLIYFE